MENMAMLAILKLAQLVEDTLTSPQMAVFSTWDDIIQAYSYSVLAFTLVHHHTHSLIFCFEQAFFHVQKLQ